jgi:glycosyltransferase involved in cell wall biosynthesis
MKVCMFVKNSFEYDARVTKEAKSLVGDGHEVTVVAIHVPGVTAQRETTPDGIRVVRVSRLSFGMRAVAKAHAGFVTRVEERRSRLTGEDLDRDRVDRSSRVLPLSTATPGENPGRPPVPRSGMTEAPATGRLTRLWGVASSVALRSVAGMVRLILVTTRASLQRPLRVIRATVLDRRFVAAGLATGAAVWHSHDLNTLDVGCRCKRKRPGTRLVYDSHELATQRSRMGDRERRRASREERRGLACVDEAIWSSASYARHAVEEHGIPFPSILRNVPELIEVKVGWDLHERLAIPADQRILLYQGSIQEHRGIEENIEAVTMLDRCVLVVIGYGHHRPALEEMVRNRGLTELVRFFGPIPNDELLYYTATADVGLCVIQGESLSYRWSLPNKLFEYLMAGIPVVASDYEEMGRVVREEGVGAVCDPADPASIAAAVSEIIDHPEAEARCRAAAREAGRKYHWGEEAKVLLALYNRLAPDKG